MALDLHYVRTVSICLPNGYQYSEPHAVISSVVEAVEDHGSHRTKKSGYFTENSPSLMGGDKGEGITS